MYPRFKTEREHTIQVNTFKGLNRSRNTEFGRISYYSSSHQIEFTDMGNMSDEYYPMISTRQKRQGIRRENAIRNDYICSNLLSYEGGIIWLEKDGCLYNNNYLVSSYFQDLGNFNDNQDRQLILMGNNLIILPDKVVLNLTTKEVTQIEQSYYSESGQGDISGEGDYIIPSIHKYVINTTFDQSQVEYVKEVTVDPTDTNNQKKSVTADYFSGVNQGGLIEYFDFGNSTNQNNSNCTSGLFMCTEIAENTEYHGDNLLTFTEMYANYTKIVRDGIGENFSVGDTVSISGIDSSCDNTYHGKIGDYIDTLCGVFKIYDRGDNYIVINAVIDKSIPYSGPIKVERLMPDMDFVIECNNRLWGCSSQNHEIYCCALGDPLNWNTYADAISTDSWVCTVGTSGDFTGVARHNDYVYFFKEECIHRISGDYPSNFTNTTIYESGVEKGSSKSLVWIGSALYYKSPEGICRFAEGYSSELISNSAFDTYKFKNAVAGRHKEKYYFSALNIQSNEYELYTYNTASNLFHKEDATYFKETVTVKDNLYFIDSETGYLICVSSENNIFNDFKNYELTGNMGKAFTDSKGQLRLYGDINGDGQVTYEDKLLLQEFVNHGLSLAKDIDSANAAHILNNPSISIQDVSAIQKIIGKMDKVQENNLSWSIVTGNLFESTLNKTKIRKIQIRMELTGNADIFVKWDSKGEFKKLKEFCNCNNQSVTVPFFPQRCDYIQVKIKGTGFVLLKYIDITYTGGSDR